MTTTRPFPVAAAAFLLVSACGQEEPAPAAEDPAAASPAVEEQAPAEPAALPRTASAEGARVFFITPADGDTVSSPVRIEFGIEVVREKRGPARSSRPH